MGEGERRRARGGYPHPYPHPYPYPYPLPYPFRQAGGAVLLHYAVCDLELFRRKRWAALGYASPNHRFRGAS